MKTWSIIWGILAACCLIAILCGATHHCITCGISAIMSFAMWPDKKDNEKDRNHGR